MIKRILVPLGTSKYTDTAIDYAIFIAQKKKAKISGMTILDMPGIEASVGSVPVGGIYWAEKLEEKLLKKAQKTVDNLKDKFIQKCKDSGIRCDIEEDQGVPSDWIIRKSKYYDMVVMGHRIKYGFNAKLKDMTTIKNVLNHAVTPILIVPQKFMEIKNVLIAFDGSLKATRALQRFVHIAHSFNFDIKVIISTDEIDLAEYQSKNLTAYFESWRIKSSDVIITQQNIRKYVHSNYKKWADLIVAGAHSKSVLSEFFVGSFTSQLIDDGKTPLFVAC